MALVSQEPTLYAGTLRDNISLGCEREVTQEEVEQAAIEANIHEFIVSLPDGYDTLAGTKGTQLSGALWPWSAPFAGPSVKTGLAQSRSKAVAHTAQEVRSSASRSPGPSSDGRASCCSMRVRSIAGAPR